MALFKITNLIKQSEKIVILPHVSADGDALGSSTALALALEKIGKKALVYLEEEIPKTFMFIPGRHLIKVYQGETDVYDLVIALDTGDKERLGSRNDIFKNTAVTVNIDHHVTNSMFADYNFVQTSSAAVSEIVYDLINISEIEIDRDMANCLYLALMTDTGGFKYSNTTCKTHHIAGELISIGADVAYISQQVFDNTSIEKVKLTGKAIETIEMYENGQVAVLTVTDEMLAETGAGDADCEGIVNIGRNIKGVEVGIMLRPKGDEQVKANLRSREYVDVSAIAAVFSGGGHKRAAGFTSGGSIESVKKELLEKIKKALVM